MIRFYDYQASESLIESLTSEVKEGRISKGKYSELFENRFSDFSGLRHCSLVNNGTTALQCALSCLGLVPGDEVILPALGYMAAANVSILMGLTPVFADVDINDLNMSVKSLKRLITAKTRCVVFIHNYGNSSRIEEIARVCQDSNLFLIEDCAEAVGTKVNGKHVGSFGDLATFSLHLAKTITAGEGGIVCTNNPNYGNKVKLLRDHGVDRNGGNPYFHVIAGYNFRISNIHATIALDSLSQINSNLAIKSSICSRYENELNLSVRIRIQSHHEIAFWAFPLICISKAQRDSLRDYLFQHGIETRDCFVAVGDMPFYKGYCTESSNGSDISSRTIFLPTHHLLSYDDVSFIIKLINEKI